MLATNAADGQAVKTKIDALNTSSKNGKKYIIKYDIKGKIINFIIQAI